MLATLPYVSLQTAYTMSQYCCIFYCANDIKIDSESSGVITESESGKLPKY